MLKKEFGYGGRPRGEDGQGCNVVFGLTTEYSEHLQGRPGMVPFHLPLRRGSIARRPLEGPLRWGM